MNKYEIFSDASWDENKLPEYLFGACLIYKNGELIYQKCKKFKKINGYNPETQNTIRSIIAFKERFLSEVSIDDIIEFKSDSEPSIKWCNKALAFVKNNNDTTTCTKMSPLKLNCIKTLQKYKNISNVSFTWINREQNSIADKIATEAKEEFMGRMCSDEYLKYMKEDLEHTLQKWTKWFTDENAKVIIDNLKEFTYANFK